jgi:hypothetical protein
LADDQVDTKEVVTVGTMETGISAIAAEFLEDATLSQSRKTAKPDDVAH